MPRSLSTAVLTENQLPHGSEPIHVLRISTFTPTAVGGPVGDLFYAGKQIEIPDSTNTAVHTTIARLGKLTNFRESTEPGRVGGFDESVVEILDPDLSLRDLVNASPAGLQGRICELSLFYHLDLAPAPSLTDSVINEFDDRLILFRGVLDTPEFNYSDRSWRFKLRDPNSLFQGDLGFRIDSQDFVDVACQASEGSILPLSIGAALRCPCALIDHPGQSYLSADFNPFDDTLAITQDRTDAGFAVGPDIVIASGPFNFEQLSGSFTSSQAYTWSTRNDILVSGTIDGVVTSGGHRYLAVPDADVTGLSLAGYLVSVEITAGNWVTLMIDQYKDFGASYSLAFEGDFTFTVGMNYRIWRWPGLLRFWPAGTPVFGVGNWVYCANFLPSRAVNEVNTFDIVPAPGGGNADPIWYQINPAFYTVTLDDKTYNAQLGRGAGDDGITTITFAEAMAALGIPWDRVRCDQDGPTGPSGGLAQYAPDVVELIAGANIPGLGQIPPELIDSASIAASLATVIADRPIKIAFTLTKRKPGMEWLGQVAFEGGCDLVWTGGKLAVPFWPGFSDAATGDTITKSVTGEWPVKTIRQREDIFTQFLAEFRPYPESRSYRYYRESSNGIAAFGRHEKEFDFEAIQRPSSVALALNHWAAWFLLHHSDIEFKGLPPSAIVKRILDVSQTSIIQRDAVADADETVLSDKGIILSQSVGFFQSAAAEGMLQDLKIAVNEWTLTIDAVAAPSDDVCNPTVPKPDIDPGFGVPPDSQGIPVP